MAKLNTMILCDIDILVKDFECVSKKTLTVPYDAKDYHAYFGEAYGDRYYGVSYLSNKPTTTKSIAVHFRNIGENVDENWVYVGFFDLYSIHVYIEELL